VNEFLRSRDAIAKLAKEDGLLPALTRPSADLFNAWPTMFSGSTREDLYEHFTQFISVDQNSSTGITTLKVRAFTPQDARRIANALVKHAEEVVNKLNDRALKQAVEFAMGIKNDAEERVIQAQARVTAFRNKEKTLDPGLQAVAVSEIVTKLTAERLSLQAALRETQLATPSSPRIPALENRLAAIDQQINQQRSLIVGANDSIVNSLAEYEKLMLKREMAARALSAALTSLEAAEQDAKRQKLYLERIVDANLPDKSTYPARLWTIFMWFAVSFAIYWIVKRVLAGIMQHGHT
jgi:capsular polysaccharide transport system permease protein